MRPSQLQFCDKYIDSQFPWRKGDLHQSQPAWMFLFGVQVPSIQFTAADFVAMTFLF
jgi:hypothetical protein